MSDRSASGSDEASRSSSRLLAPAQLALGMAVFGSATPVSKIVASATPVFVGSAARVGLAALVLAPVALRGEASMRDLSRRDWISVAMIALVGVVGFSVLMLYGMRLVSGVVGAVVMSTAPAVTAAASMAFFGDRPTWRKLAAIALAVAGVLILHIGGSGGSGSGGLVLGSALVFAAVCCEATYTLLGRQVSQRIDPVLVAFLAAALATPLLIPFAAVQWPQTDWPSLDAGDWAALGWYGAGTFALGTWLWYSGLAKTEGVVAAGFMGIMPASALVLSYVLLDEPFEPMHLAGFAVVFAGVLLMSWEHARSAQPSAGGDD